MRDDNDADSSSNGRAKIRKRTASLILSPDEVYQLTADTAAHKHHYPLPKLIVLGILAGAFIGLGYSLCCLVGGLMSYDLRHEEPGLFNFLFSIFGFPMGLTLCVVAGADLFTSNCMYVTIAVAEGRYGALGVLRTLVVSYLSNIVGALMLVGLMTGGEVFKGRGDFVIELALKKTHNSFGVTFCRGLLCNWLVCLAVWQGNMARDFTGKFVGIFLPNSAFVAMGFEHCIANLFLVPLSMVLGSGISVGTFVGRNLIPATLGNIVGGAFFVGAMYAMALGTPGHIIQDAWEHHVVRRAGWCGEEGLEEEGAQQHHVVGVPHGSAASFKGGRNGAAATENGGLENGVGAGRSRFG